MRNKSLKLSKNIIEKTGQGYKEIIIPPAQREINSKKNKTIFCKIFTWMDAKGLRGKRNLEKFKR